MILNLKKQISIIILSTTQQSFLRRQTMTTEIETINESSTDLKNTDLKTSTTIIVSEIVLPENVELIAKKTATIFVKDSSKFVLKGRTGEVTNATKDLGPNLLVYSNETIEKCHLGKTRGVVRGIKNTKELQEIINKYFI